MKGLYKQALSDFNKALKINPEYAEAYNKRAVTYYNHEEYVLAWKDTKKAESLNKFNPLFVLDLRNPRKK
jgi:tetratricopeptide (TPR) repeat protein